MLRSTLFACALASTVTAFSQGAEPRGVCGTREVDLDRLRANIAHAEQHRLAARSADTTFVPVHYVLFGEEDSTGVAKTNNLLDLLGAVNEDFAPLGMQFFLKASQGASRPWDIIYDDELTSDPRGNRDQLTRLRAEDAITIFVPENASALDSENPGVTLGYYDSGRDYLVFRRAEVADNASTASHEFGHYFGLPHTFFGWDLTTWEGTTTTGEEAITSPVDTAIAPFYGAKVELVTRDTGANCADAGDLFCDTPADYNLGFGYPDCDYRGDVSDANGDLLRPDESNFMGYFLGCNPYSFSGEQTAAMLADLASGRRDFLRGSRPTAIGPITDEIVYLSPLPSDTVSTFGDVLTIEWEPVAGAQYYVVEVDTRRDFRGANEVILPAEQTRYDALDLRTNRRYYYRVRAFSDASFGERGETMQIITSERLSGLVEGSGPEPTSLTVVPNPAPAGVGFGIRIDGSPLGEAVVAVQDLTGRRMSRERLDLSAIGATQLVPSTQHLLPGTYVLTVSSPLGVSSNKIVIE